MRATRYLRNVWAESLLALVALAFAVCGVPWSDASARPTALADHQQILRVSLNDTGSQAGLALLDPARSGAGSGASQALSLIFSGLMTYDDHLRPVPALAEQVTVSPDALTYTFHLRRGARFTDGTPITSTDAAYSIARLVMGDQSGAGAFFSALAGYDAATELQQAYPDATIARLLTTGPLRSALQTPDPQTLIIHLSRPDGALLSKLAAPFSGVVERTFDAVLGVSQNPDVGAMSLPGYHSAPGRTLTLLYLDTLQPPLNDPRARAALILALNRVALAHQALSPASATATLIPPGTPGYTATVTGAIAGVALTGDPPEARALWLAYVHDHCGGAASSCPPVLLCDNGPYCSGDTPLTAALIAMWQAALPGVRVVTLNWVGFLGVPPNARFASIMLGRWTEDFPDPQDSVSALMGCAPWPANPPGLALATAAEASPTIGVRFTEYQLAQASLLNEANVAPLTQGSFAWLARPGVAGFPSNPLPWMTPDQ